ncbi:MAG TPA: fibronectin type III domain-containing protein [Patescibacteria group bacterium]|nr:fibronectin type III domain-containing protein [Patescibacteria group bacterium]
MASFLDKKHIPTVLGILILGIGLVGGIILVNQTGTTGFLPRASPETTPKNLKVTNTTDTGFTVSWVTDIKTPGYIKYGTTASNLSVTVTDDRDQISGSVDNYITHHVTFRSLQAGTQYYYKIGTGANLLYDNNGTPYTTTTAGSSTSGTSSTMYGQVQNASGVPAPGVLVYVASDVSAPLSTLTQTSGSWVIPLSNARSKDLRQSASFSPDTVLTLLITDGTQSSTVTVKFSGAQPVPEITLGQSSDFTVVIASGEPTPTPAEITEQLQNKFTSQLLSPATEVANNSVLTITYPATDNEVISLQQPALAGTGPAQTRIALTISGTASQTASVTTTGTGTWTYTPTKKLINGNYTLNASATVNGAVQSIN